ncbi:unnamed protein product [Linum trigynum]|uniref:Uncharacterized protein n=1 Tax=Linum trigynum TaxID=586398 RepID=A0AAV2DDI2_9ROSI
MAAFHDDDDEEFLSQLAFAEANALSRINTSDTNKRRILDGYNPEEDEEKQQQPLKKMTVATVSAAKMKEEEGAYMAALRGSKSLSWQQNPLNRSSSGVKTVAAAVSASRPHFDGGGDYDRSERQQPSVSEKDCPCGQGACVVFTANTERNRGRQFYRCPLRQENGGCGFFEWCDKASGNNSSVSNSDLPCPCGAGFCLLLTAKNGKNIGQQFYRCPASQESACGFFKWCNETDTAASNPTSTSESSKIVHGARTGSACFKCGNPAHWAKDCPISSSSDSPAAAAAAATSFGGRRPVSSSPNSACYKCGKPGHWARDCTSSQSTGATRRY